MSTNLSYGNDLLINVESLEKKTDLNQLPAPSSAIRQLIDDHILRQASSQNIPNTDHFTDRDYLGICICQITVNSIILPHKSWQFKFDLWIKNKSKWYFHTFQMSRDNFKQLHANINYNENNTGLIHNIFSNNILAHYSYLLYLQIKDNQYYSFQNKVIPKHHH